MMKFRSTRPSDKHEEGSESLIPGNGQGSESDGIGGLLQRVLQGSRDGLWEWNPRTGQVFYSPKWSQVLGLEPSGARASLEHWLDRVHPEDRPQLEARLESVREGRRESLEFEFRIRHENGKYRWVIAHARPTRDEQEQCLWLTGSLSDINERKHLEKSVFSHSFFDPLTGLPNRSTLLNRIRQRLSDADRESSLMVLALDRSRDARMALGPESYDRLTVQLARYLRSIFEERYTVARLDDSLFAILLDEGTGSSSSLETARALIAQIPAKTFKPSNRELSISISIGLVRGHSGYASGQDMLRDGVTALEIARTKGSEELLVFEPMMSDRAISRLHLEQELRVGLTLGRVHPVFQPMVSMETGKLAGFEALGRLWLEDGRVIPPQGFLGIATEIGKIGEVDRLVLRDVCRTWRDWRRAGVPLQNLFFSVNASPQLLSQSDLIPWLDGTMREVGMDPSRLILEITENCLDWQPELVANGLRHVHSLGVRLALDGLGRGNLCLGRFESLPFESVKIDHRAIRHGQPDLVLSPLLTLAKNLGLKAVVQGLETRSDAQNVQRLGFDYGQGFFFSEPLDKHEAVHLAISPDPIFWPEQESSTG